MTTKTRITQLEKTSKPKPKTQTAIVKIYDATKPLPKPNDTGVTVFIPDNGRDKLTAKP